MQGTAASGWRLQGEKAMTEKELYLDRILWPVTALGPGKRAALWVAGCKRHCPYCANPELWERKPEQRISVEKAAALLRRLWREKKPEGLTITGGEPFDQATALDAVLEGLEEDPGDVLLYTGYQREELLADPHRRRLLARADVLIDGPYLEERNVPSAVLRGSENQRIFFRNARIEEKYREYLEKGRQIQNFVYDYRILSVGIHSRGTRTEHGEKQEMTK